MVNNLHFDYYCTQIVSWFVVSDVFGQFHVAIKDWPRSPVSSKMRSFVIIVDNFQPLAIVTKSLIWKTKMVLDPFLVSSPHLWGCSLEGYAEKNYVISVTVQIMFWFGWRDQIPSLLTSFKSFVRSIKNDS